jgi:glycine cleavage system H protein
MKLDTQARYSQSHEWVRQDGDVFVCGITDHAQAELSDVVYVDLPAVGSSFASDDPMGTVESVKAASDLNMPMGGVITEVNRALDNTPDAINRDPFGAGWIIKFTAADPSQWDRMLSAEEYERLVAM